MSEAVVPTGQAFASHPSTVLIPARTDELGSRGTGDILDADATLRLRPSFAAPSLARNRVRWICSTLDLPEQVVRDAAFVAGELVAISVRQVRAPLELNISVGRTHVTVRISDLGAGQFARSRPNGVGTNRSLQLVQCVSQSWGVSVTADGREMWASIARRSRAE